MTGKGDNMATVIGSQILARALQRLDVDTMFYLMGGPMLAAEIGLHRGGHPLDRRPPRAGRRDDGPRLRPGPQQARRLHGRLRPGHDEPGDRRRRTPGPTPRRCSRSAAPARSASSARAPSRRWTRSASSSRSPSGPSASTTPRRIPELVAMAVRQALDGSPGPVYLDMPGDVLYQRGRRGQHRLPGRRPGADAPPAARRPGPGRRRDRACWRRPSARSSSPAAASSGPAPPRSCGSGSS